jgi:ferrous iron transport protein B
MVVALTMVDLAERNGLRTDPAALARRLGCPVVPVVAPARKGLVELRQAITAQLRGVAPQRAPLPDVLEAAAAGALELPDITLKYLCAGWRWRG